MKSILSVPGDDQRIARSGKAPKKSAKKPRKTSAGQKETLIPITGKKQKATTAKKPAARPQRKSA